MGALADTCAKLTNTSNCAMRSFISNIGSTYPAVITKGMYLLSGFLGIYIVKHYIPANI